MIIKILVLSMYPILWGFYAHKIINKHAVYALPGDLGVFYRTNIQYVEEKSVAADIRKFTNPQESPKHYIDLEYYTKYLNAGSLNNVTLDSLQLMVPEDSIRSWGSLPWAILHSYSNLVYAFKSSDWEEVLKVSADLGHYVADAHVPLHTTRNYNGQLTNQHGIHALWETQIPETFAHEYFLYGGSANYIKDPESLIKQIITESHTAYNLLINVDSLARRNFNEGQLFQNTIKNGKPVKSYSKEYVSRLNNDLNNQVNERMKLAINRIGSFWLTAWIEAGQPRLPSESYNREKTKVKYPRNSLPEREY